MKKIFIGTYTTGNSKGIYSASFDEEHLQITDPVLCAEIENPSFIEIDSQNKKLYAVSEKKNGEIACFSIADEQSGSLNLIGRLETGGPAPCHIEISPDKKIMIVSNYGGSIAVFRIGQNGLEKINFFQNKGSGPNKRRQESSHPHQAVFSPDSKYIFVPDLGTDEILAYPYDPKTLAVSALDRPAFKTKPGAGPRHLLFLNPNRAYLINELDNTVISLQYDSENCEFREIESLSTLPANFAGENIAAEIALAPSGKYLYASNRGHNSIAIFYLEDDGTMELAGFRTGEINFPRHISVSENIMLVANQKSASVLGLKVEDNGTLSEKLFSISIDNPTFAKFF